MLAETQLWMDVCRCSQEGAAVCAEPRGDAVKCRLLEIHLYLGKQFSKKDLDGAA